MGKQVGFDCKMYYCVAGIGGTPTWTELTLAKDVNVTFQVDEAEASDRGSIFKKYLAGMIELGFTVEINRNVGNVTYTTLKTAFLARNHIGIAVASGDIETTGTEVVEADVRIFNFDISEALSETSTVSLTFKPSAKSSNEPSFTTVA